MNKNKRSLSFCATDGFEARKNTVTERVERVPVLTIPPVQHDTESSSSSGCGRGGE